MNDFICKKNKLHLLCKGKECKSDYYDKPAEDLEKNAEENQLHDNDLMKSQSSHETRREYIQRAKSERSKPENAAELAYLELRYPNVEDHGIIGNMKTCALVTYVGTINWMCFPHFDSPSIFGSMLDTKKGGYFKICPSRDSLLLNTKQFYNSSETNILATRFFVSQGVVQVTDYMPVHLKAEKRSKRNFLIRKIQCQSGEVSMRVTCKPAFDYARKSHEISLQNENQIIFKSQDLSMQLVSSLPIDQKDIQNKHKSYKKVIHLKEGESCFYFFGPIDEDHQLCKWTKENLENRFFNRTTTFWRTWLSRCSYKGRWREMVYRSVLLLKLLTFEKTGAIIAAPTTSIPETIGGNRNWDYRYTWIRDAAFTLYAFLRLGFTEEAANFMNYLSKVASKAKDMEPQDLKERGPLQVMYKIDGSSFIPEETLDHLEGYRGSTPVRIGNGAYSQLQLDIYGELLDSLYLYNKYGAPLSYDCWMGTVRMVDWVCENWMRKDEGIWEVRSEKNHFVYSKVMCWVCVDRALRLADRRSFPAPRDRWMKVRDEIYLEVMKNGWNEEKQCFVQFYGSDTLDASALIMPLVFFTAPNDPRLVKTLDLILKPINQGGLTKNSLVYRYDLDKTCDGIFGAEEGTFNMCSFWLIEALTRVSRHYRERMQDARQKFEEILSYANHLGLYGEELSTSGQQLGNFPQAFSHIALISCAFNLDRDLNSQGSGAPNNSNGSM